MSENDNLQDADGKIELNTTETPQTPEESKVAEASTSEEIKESIETTETTPESTIETEGTTVETIDVSEAVKEDTTETSEDVTVETEVVSEEAKDIATEEVSEPVIETSDKAESHVEEIDEANAEDAEDETNAERHEVESKDYHAMTMEQLVDELEALIKDQKIQTIKSQVDEIKSEFHSKFGELLEEKKEEFLSEGGNVIDFYFTTPVKKRFNDAFKSYRNSLNAYYKALESNLKQNLENRLTIIEEIKGLINVEENINTTYKHFKDLQEQWRNAGPIPRDRYNNAWNSYHHHVEVFYDFLHLNRDLRDMDFKHNLDKKTKIIERAEELAADDNINRSFRELQVLHKLWKEELGPVGREHREEVWERFSNATKTIHDKRQAYYADLDKAHEVNLVKKEDIISKIEDIAQDQPKSHQAWQNKIKAIETLRQDFFNAGKVPIKVNDATWTKFKTAVRNFNRSKNTFYKSLKKDQFDNLHKKQELIKLAEENKDSDDFDKTTSLMKKIQSDWKSIGHVPRKDSDKIWKQFKKACNHYFDRMHEERNAASKEEMAAFEEKSTLLETVKAIELSGKPEKDIETIKTQINAWKAIGHIPSNKRFIDGKFNKVIDGLFGKLDMDKAKLEMMKFENKLETLSNPNDTRLLDNEQNYIRKKITEIKGEINQLENNMQFFSNVDESNPLVRDVIKNINNHKDSLQTWENKLRKVKSMY
ncbi:DUF349 domain-containing protein [Psychroserpens ponticola]|uniref:DUF349 domain-containing protein n=1 Tax=Psychroserpens ponticola TaxID=2932268 RepID=A0ABY7RVM9_9FLAO|nr:DUF349 domain-containing protein [Psychroserpens ponticola]WCO00756.1 DUF349 domain-containing protein [Psychroserpens ponticola]